MPKNYLIGIGGTGARVVEAVVHCCAAGLGPGELTTFLVDPDVANGNLAQTTSLLSLYKKARARIQRRQDGFAWCRCQIKTPDPAVWSIFQDQRKTTLADFVALGRMANQRKDLADFASVLFTPQELETPLNRGFRGHPSIGAVVMANPPADADPWKQFWTDVSEAQGSGDIRVFFVGSVFGGTGAAGVPTFGAENFIKNRQAHSATERTAASDKVVLGAALVLPYFTFTRPDGEAEKREQMFVTAADFPDTTKAALAFYHTKTLAFHQVYLLGDSLGQGVGAFSTGSNTQNNRAHYIELATALAALDFFREAGGDSERGQYFTAARSGTTIDWGSLPVSRDASQLERHRSDLLLRMATWFTGTYALNTYGKQLLDMPHKDVREAWYGSTFRFDPKREEERSRDPRQAEARQTIDATADLGMRSLRWIADISEAEHVRLVARDRIFKDGDRLASYGEHAANLGQFLVGAGKDASLKLNFGDFVHTLNAARGSDVATSPGDQWLHRFHDAARDFSARNYRLDVKQIP